MISAALDTFIAGIGLLVLSPLLAVIGGLIALTSGFPVLFRQTRIGKDGVPFSLLKFRSMRAAASGAQITSSEDARITAIGRILRKHKLDELPQLWNVLKGDMCLVGPRPEVPKFVDLDDPTWQAVLKMKPGITDLASLLYRNEEEMLAEAQDVEDHYRRVILPAKLALNLEYSRVRSYRSDLHSIVLTIWHSLLPVKPDPVLIRKLLLGSK